MPLTIEDRFAIMDLMARYNHAADSGDAEGFADTFADDALFEGSMKTARGRAELIEVIRSTPPDRPARHWNNNILIEGDGDDATAKVYLLRFDVSSAPPTIIGGGVYHDVLKRIDGRWRFTHRKVVSDNRPD